MKIYNNPQISIVSLETADIVTISIIDDALRDMFKKRETPLIVNDDWSNGF